MAFFFVLQLTRLRNASTKLLIPSFIAATNRFQIRVVANNWDPLFFALLNTCSSNHFFENGEYDPNHRKGQSLQPRSIAILGGGLAGLSVAYHLLNHAQPPNEKSSTNNSDRSNPIDTIKNENIEEESGKNSLALKSLKIRIYDKAFPGEGGASSVAGGFLHPFSPRGKLIHQGITALQHSNQLVEAALSHSQHCIIRPHLYRIAQTEANERQLKQSAVDFPELATWMNKDEVCDQLGIDSLGGLKLEGGCRVLHVPSYLQGLWEECLSKAEQNGSEVCWEKTEILPTNSTDSTSNITDDAKISAACWKDVEAFNNHLSTYDTVILSCGSGIFNNKLLHHELNSTCVYPLPVQLVRGQSVELSLSTSEDARSSISGEALLCGKYISPLPLLVANSISDAPDSNRSETKRFLIGATHEYTTDRFDKTKVIEELKTKTYDLAPNLWDHGRLDRLTVGTRVQSRRGKHGRVPIIGRYTGVNTKENSEDSSRITVTGVKHDNLWVFTGLGSRGLIYHGLLGRWLAKAVLHEDEGMLQHSLMKFEWWKNN